jgi:flagellar FliL protein
MSEKKAKEPKKEVLDEQSEGPARKGGMLKIILIAVVAMVIGGAGAFVVLKKFMPPAAPVAQAEQPVHTPAAPPTDEEPIVAPTKGGTEGGGHGGGAEGAEAAVVAEGPITVELKPFTTNLNEPSGRRFLKVTVGMEVDNQEGADELNRKMSDIQDSILILLSSQSIEDIANVDGKERLRSQILNRTNNYMVKNKVKKVKYSDFVIQ